MPIPTDTLHPLGKLNRWFAVSSVAMMASIVWFIWEDYDRPWRGFQDDYMVAQAALAHLDYLETQMEEYQKKVDAAEGRLEEAKEVTASRAEERRRVEQELADANAEHDGIKIEHGNADSIVQVTRSEYEVALSAYGPDNPITKGVKARLDAQEAEAARLKTERERIEDAQRALKEQLKDIESLVRDAEKALFQLEKVAEDAANKEDQYSNVLVKGVINAPLLDFTAPKGTPARHEVKQLVLPEVRQELNYLQTYTTDRCTTCHISIDNPDFLPGNLARRLERALPAINEALIRDGATPMPTPVLPELKQDNAPDLEAGKVTEFWSYLSKEQQDRYFGQLLERVNNYLVQSGRKEIKLEQPLLAHPNQDLFVNIDSAHPMTTMGCTVCHEGNPQETDFVQAAHTPISHEQEHEWAEKYYVTAAFVPNVTFATVEHYWDFPMLPPRYAEAGCAKCHTEISDIAQFQGETQAQKINLGRDLFTRVGCVNCHNVDDLGPQRKVGPDLTRVASKLDRDFAEPWIYHPKRFRPSTWMPHFFLQENNNALASNLNDPDPVLRTETETMAMAYYLFTLSQPFEGMPIPDGLSGDVERGRKLFSEVGCLACHGNVHEYGREMVVSDLTGREGRTERVAEALFEEMTYNEKVYHLIDNTPSDRDTVYAPESIGEQMVFTRHAPELSSVGSKVSREWLFTWLKDPSVYDDHTRMPSLRLTDQEALDLTEYLLTLKDNDAFEEGRFPEDAEHLEMADELVFTLLSGQNSARRSRSIMEDEGGELTDMLAKILAPSVGDEEIRTTLAGLETPEKRMLFLGNKMIAHYGCYACHTIAGFETSPPPGTDMSNWGKKPLSQLDFAFFDHAHEHIREANPEVFGNLHLPENEELIYWSHGQNPKEAVTHTHSAFAKHKMLNPRIWDREKIKAPYDKLKMPNFYFTEKQADALVTYLLSRKPPRVNDSLQVDYDSTLTGAIAEGRNLSRSLNCVGCHRIENNVATVHQYYTKDVGGDIRFDETNAPPSLWGEGAKVQYPWLYGFLNQVEELRPWLNIRMPSFNLTEEETTTLVEYFAGIAREESRVLTGHLKQVNEYLERAHARVEAEGAANAPDPETWYITDGLRDTADFLARYSVENRLVLSFDVDPVENTVDQLKYGFGQVTENTSFIADLYDVRFPFADQPRPMVDDERFARGEAFFYELKCLACHVLGDPYIEGSNPNPSAPNLNLTHKRLRQDWVHAWLQEPGTIQPGTQMPQWFDDGNSAFGSYPEDDRNQLEAEYGQAGEEQMQLLMDFMYNAGAKNYTATQPGGLPGAAGGAEGDGEEEEWTGEDEEWSGEEEEEAWDGEEEEEEEDGR